VCADSVGGTIDSAASSTCLKGFADGRGVTEQGPQEGLRTSLLAPRARQLSCPPRLLPFEVLAGEEPSVLVSSISRLPVAAARGTVVEALVRVWTKPAPDTYPSVFLSCLKDRTASPAPQFLYRSGFC
jgi:hypothetical protein